MGIVSISMLQSLIRINSQNTNNNFHLTKYHHRTVKHFNWWMCNALMDVRILIYSFNITTNLINY